MKGERVLLWWVAILLALCVIDYRINMQPYHHLLQTRSVSVVNGDSLALNISRAAVVYGRLMAAQFAVVLVPAGMWLWRRRKVED